MTPRHSSDNTYAESLAGNPPSPIYWVKAIRELGAVGALIGIAGYTVFRLVSGVPTTQDIAEVKATLGSHVATTNIELVNVRVLLRAICFNTAKTDNERAACQVTEK